jgi:hypothetical protein
MAARRRKRTTRRRTTARRTTRRRTTRRASGTRRRRRRNPKMKFDMKGTAVAAAGGLAAGAGAYALDGQDLAPMTKAGILAGGGLVLGILVSGWHSGLGAGIAGAGVALGGKMALEKYMAEKATTEGMGRIPNYGFRKYGRTPQVPYYRNMPQFGAVRTDLGAVQTDIGAVEAELRGVEASLY